jgi:hypothetical protein
MRSLLLPSILQAKQDWQPQLHWDCAHAGKGTHSLELEALLVLRMYVTEASTQWEALQCTDLLFNLSIVFSSQSLRNIL